MQLFDDVLGLAGVLALLLDLVAGVHDGGMVAFEYLCNIGEGVFKLLPDHVHCHLPRVGHILGAVYVTDGIADRCSLLEDRKMQVVH